MRLLLLSAVMLSGAISVAFPASSVEAHARLDTAQPVPDSALLVAPAEVRIWFTQELRLRGNELYVLDGEGNQVDNADAQVDQTDPDRKQLVVSLPPLPAGTYTVHYTSQSAEDGHPYTDAYQFTVESEAAQAPICPEATS